MYDLTQFSLRDMSEFGLTLRQISKDADNIEDVSNRIIQYLDQNLIDQKTGKKSCALVHFFTTHAYGELPKNSQKSVNGYFESEQPDPQLKCLTLLASTGQYPDWNSGESYQKNLVIPLGNEHEISGIDLMSKLIQSWGIDQNIFFNNILESQRNLEKVGLTLLNFDQALTHSKFLSENLGLIVSNVQSILGVWGQLPSGHLFIVLMFLKVRVPKKTLDLIRPMALNIKTAILPFDGDSVFSKPQQSSIPCEIVTKPNKDQIIENLKSQVIALNQLLDISEKSSLIQSERLEKIIANQQKKINQIQSTQVKLIHTEKMSSLGKIVAGIAHEINNPINFIYGNIFHLQNYTQDLLKVLQLYQDKYPEPPEDIKTEIESIDLDFVKEDTNQILKSMRQGSQRISTIVKSLQNFVRSDEAKVKPVDIHQGIDSTITLLQNRLISKSNLADIQIIKDYGNIPKVECYPGEINQVFMNILSNAIDALAEYKNSSEHHEIPNYTAWIKIQTEVSLKNQIRICISDNGCGMSEEVRSKIFDPFFTTKPVGSGTGLGLSASYQIIVEKHHGKLFCYSTAGKGTKFVIEIPTQQQMCRVA